MNDIHCIYHNEIGIAFQWKRNLKEGTSDTLQIVFRNTCFYLNYKEIKQFYDKAKAANTLKQCDSCNHKEKCNSYLLQTPLEKVDLAVSYKELNLITDLLKGTLFHLELNAYITTIGIN